MALPKANRFAGSNYIPIPPPSFEKPKPRTLIFKQWTRGALVFDPTRNARANPNRSYVYETNEESWSNGNH